MCTNNVKKWLLTSLTSPSAAHLQLSVVLFLVFGLRASQALYEEKEIVIAGPRFYMCDPKCVLEKCSDADDDVLCVLIVEVDPDGFLAEFPSTCAFNCANRCYENQLDILKKTKCSGKEDLKTMGMGRKNIDNVIPDVVEEDDEDQFVDD